MSGTGRQQESSIGWGIDIIREYFRRRFDRIDHYLRNGSLDRFQQELEEINAKINCDIGTTPAIIEMIPKNLDRVVLSAG